MHGWNEWGVSHGYLGLFLILAAGVIVPLPEDTTLLFVGYLVSRGKFELIPAWSAAALGCLTGIMVSYMIGRSAGLMFVNRFGHYVGITPERLERTTQWFHRVGKWGLLLGYFVPGVRHLTALIAGSSKVRWPVFMLFAGSGAVIWASIFLALGYCLRDGWKRFGAGFNQHRIAVLLGVVLIMAVFLIWDWRRIMKAKRTALNAMGQASIGQATGDEGRGSDQ
jgi:membrane protein DedA with SNARE-associated domain